MENKIEECPNCGNYVEGKVVRTDEQEITRFVAKKGSNKVLMYIAALVLGNFVFPIVGSILGFIICFVVASYIDNYSNKATDAIESSIFKTLKYEYVCPKCGHEWVREMAPKDDFTPIEILRQERNNIMTRLENSVFNQKSMSYICGITTILSLLYCVFADYRTSLGMKDGFFGRYEDFDYNYLWYFLALVCFFAAIGFIFHYKNYQNIKGTLEIIKDLSDEGFRNSPLRFRYR